jgi:hypothetical protein
LGIRVSLQTIHLWLTIHWDPLSLMIIEPSTRSIKMKYSRYLGWIPM